MDYKKKYVKYKNKYLDLKGGFLDKYNCKHVKDNSEKLLYYVGTVKGDNLEILPRRDNQSYLDKLLYKCDYKKILDLYKDNLIWGFGIEQELPILFDIPKEIKSNIELRPYIITLPDNNNYLLIENFTKVFYYFNFNYYSPLNNLPEDVYNDLQKLIEQISKPDITFNFNNLLQNNLFLLNLKKYKMPSPGIPKIKYLIRLLKTNSKLELIIKDLKSDVLKRLQNNKLIYDNSILDKNFIEKNIKKITLEKKITENKYYIVTNIIFKITFINDVIEVSNYYNIKDNENLNEFTKILEKDSGGYELRTDRYKKTTIQNAVNALKDKRDYMINLFKRVYSTKSSLYFPDDYLFYKQNNKYFYTGELELNITLPYNKSLEEDPINNPNRSYEIINFKTRHMNLMKFLQYLSPLFLGCFTSTFPESFNDNHNNPETSYRFYLNLESIRILVTDVNNIYGLLKDDYRTGNYN